MKRILPLIGLLFFSCGSPSPEKKTSEERVPLKSHRIFQPAELKEDFKILITTLREAHPDLYRVHSREIIDRRIAAIDSAISKPQSYLEFLKLIAPLFVEIGCIHTQWSQSPDFIRFRNDSIPLFPLQLEIRDEHFYVKRNFSSDLTIHEGTEIISIDGEKAGPYLSKNYALLPVDGEIESIQQRWLEAYFPNHHSNFWEQPDTFQLVLKNKDGLIEIKMLPALLKKEFRTNQSVPAVSAPLLQFSITDSIGLLTIRSFDETALIKSGFDYNSFLDSSFNELRRQKIFSLILDLRGNSEGDLICGEQLFSRLSLSPFTYVTQIKGRSDTAFSFRNHITSFPAENRTTFLPLTREMKHEPGAFPGRLFVLTDGWNTGAAGFFCARIQKRPLTYFAGEETGSCTFGMNTAALTLLLPNTGISVMIPTIQLIADSKNYISVRGVKPNYSFPETNPGELVEKMTGQIKKEQEMYRQRRK